MEACWPLNLPRELRGRHLTTTLILPSPASAIVDSQATRCAPAASLSKKKQLNVVGAHNVSVTSALENNLHGNVLIRKYLLTLSGKHTTGPQLSGEAFATSLVTHSTYQTQDEVSHIVF